MLDTCLVCFSQMMACQPLLGRYVLISQSQLVQWPLASDPDFCAHVLFAFCDDAALPL